jgi:hypothetical protein
MPDIYWAANGAMPTTAALAKVATGTSIKTMLQIATPSTRPLTVVGWGVSFDGSAAGTPIICELIETDVAATVTAHVASGIMKYNDPNAPPSLVTLGTSATGYTATAEGTITAVRYGDLEDVQPTNQYAMWFPEGREFQVAVSKFLRVRVTAGASVGCHTWIAWIEA